MKTKCINTVDKWPCLFVIIIPKYQNEDGNTLFNTIN